MSGWVTVFVNERPTPVPPGSTIRDAVAEFDPELGAAVADESAYVTDGVGRRVNPAGSVAPGTIIRVVRGAGRGRRGTSTP
ncbi:MAG: hypothetical protein GTN62_02315 [Gemmatimonadales bacterium]|nr:hypothetical protein [Gemmatimonadales bacterium]NIN10788.1 hypothetical protein [Gemmatimonadales bacterium]NIN48934.1 hypothetical protein [Gemmatimonadales bacterium]NIP06398.1 hypothetical protein [Gemmatimonadales bacterium]NIR00209.1 hypothetical protein [Gemmatimonadales bacterium]